MIRTVMQVGYLNPFQSHGGVEKYILIHAKALNTIYGLSVDVLCAGDFTGTSQSQFGKVITLGVPLFRKKSLFFISKYFYAKKVKKYLTHHSNDYNAIHFHGDNGTIINKYSSKSLLTLHGVGSNKTSLKKRIKTFITYRIELNNVKKARLVFSVSLEAKELFGRFKDKINMIKVPLETDLYKEPTEVEKKAARSSLGIDPDRVVGLIIGRDPFRKGLNIAIDAVTQIHDASILLVAIGFPSKVKETNNILYTGDIDDDTKLLYLKAANFFIFPSSKEGFPASVLEAACMGLALIVSKQSGVSELKDLVPFYREIDSSLAEEYSNALKEFVKDFLKYKLNYNPVNPNKIDKYSIKNSAAVYMSAYSKLEKEY